MSEVVKCANALCEKPLDTKVQFSIRVNAKTFCSTSCYHTHAHQENLFEYAARGAPPDYYKRPHKPPKPWWVRGF